MAQSPAQKNLTIAFVFLSLLFGSVFSLIHFTLSTMGLQTELLSYTPYVIGASIIVYFLHFRHRIAAVNFLGAGRSTVPTVFFMAIILSPATFLNLTAPYTDKVVELDSVENVSTTKASEFSLKKYFFVRDQMIDTVTTSSGMDDDMVKNSFSYIAMVPLVDREGDTAFTTWMTWMTKSNSVDGELTEDVSRQIQKDFLESCRAEARELSHDSIVYFSIMKFNSNYKEMLTGRGKLNERNVFLFSSTETLGADRAGAAWVFGIAYLVLLIFFWGAVALGHLEPITND